MLRYLERVASLQCELRQRRIDLLLLAPGDHMRYLTGWSEPSGERLLCLGVPADEEPVFLVPSIYNEDVRLRASQVNRVVSWTDDSGWAREFADLVAPSRAGVIGIDDDLPGGHLLAMQSLAPRARFTHGSPAVTALRMVKSPDELACLEAAASVTDRVCDAAVAELRQGITERAVAERVMSLHKELGATPTFAIVSFGSHCAIPHHRSGRRELRPGDIVILDIGGEVDGYQSDITRTFAFGKADSEAARVYDVVLQAHNSARAAARPGATCSSVDAAAREVITAAGFGEQFIHRTGHGIGLSGHEPPYIVAGNDLALSEGMCFSDEPGIYFSGRYGVRIENILCVEAEGSRSLNADAPQALPVLPGGRL